MSAETPFFFTSGDRQLFGILHESSGAATGTPFVFCHPFGEEKLWAHRVYVNYARALSRQGHPVLRFDYFGNGDSDGTFEESSIESAMADIASAIDLLKTRCRAQSVNLLGLRLGASLAALTASRRQDVDSLVLWAPITSGERYIQELLRINLTTQMAVFKEIRADREALAAVLSSGASVNVDGYDVSADMYSQLRTVQLEALTPAASRGCLIVQVERAAGAPQAPDLERLGSVWKGCTVTVVQEEPFWKEIKAFYDNAPNLFRCTEEWLQQR